MPYPQCIGLGSVFDSGRRNIRQMLIQFFGNGGQFGAALRIGGEYRRRQAIGQRGRAIHLLEYRA